MEDQPTSYAAPFQPNSRQRMLQEYREACDLLRQQQRHVAHLVTDPEQTAALQQLFFTMERVKSAQVDLVTLAIDQLSAEIALLEASVRSPSPEPA